MNVRFLVFALLLSNWACQAQKTEGNADPEQAGVAKTAETTAVPDTFDCRLHGLQLKSESHWMADKQMLFAVAAQGEDINGDAPIYRSFQVYTTQDCNMISYTLMPDNFNNEPYRLQAQTYEEANELVCAQGFENSFCYHVRRKEMILPIFPKYKTPRKSSSETGRPMGMSVWQKYLFGFTKLNGAYAYDISERMSPKAIMPNAEYIDRNSKSFKQLFLLKGEEGYQAFIPVNTNGQIKLKTLLPKVMDLSAKVIQDRKTGRYAIARTIGDRNPLAFDLQEGRLLTLPKELKETQAIFDHLAKTKH